MSLPYKVQQKTDWADRTYKLRFPAGAGYGKVGQRRVLGAAGRLGSARKGISRSRSLTAGSENRKLATFLSVIQSCPGGRVRVRLP